MVDAKRSQKRLKTKRSSVRPTAKAFRATLNKASISGKTPDFDLLIAQCDISALRLA
jgi:hypothetical protein